MVFKEEILASSDITDAMAASLLTSLAAIVVFEQTHWSSNLNVAAGSISYDAKWTQAHSLKRDKITWSHKTSCLTVRGPSCQGLNVTLLLLIVLGCSSYLLPRQEKENIFVHLSLKSLHIHSILFVIKSTERRMSTPHRELFPFQTTNKECFASFRKSHKYTLKSQ